MVLLVKYGNRRLTFGSMCLLPLLIYVSRLCSLPHQEEVLQETQKLWSDLE